SNGAGRAGLRVRAYDRDLPSRERRGGAGPQLLGEGIADAEGRFAIEFDAARYEDGEAELAAELAQRRGSGHSPDLSFRVFDRGGRELVLRRVTAQGREAGPEQILFNAVSPLEVALAVE